MELFTFVIIIVLIVVFGDIAVKIGGPLANRLADLMGAMAEDRRLRRDDDAPPAELPAGAIEDLEARLARIEDRLDFIEALRAPDQRSALTAGRADRRDD